jgi:hypothetical protein
VPEPEADETEEEPENHTDDGEDEDEDEEEEEEEDDTASYSSEHSDHIPETPAPVVSKYLPVAEQMVMTAKINQWRRNHKCDNVLNTGKNKGKVCGRPVGVAWNTERDCGETKCGFHC